MARDDLPRPGRPRSEHCRVAALEAAADLLAELPYPQVTIEGIAERAGVSKQTIYKWWKSRPALCMEAYGERVRHHFTPPEGDTARDQLVFLLTLSCRLLRAGNNGCVVAGFIAEAQSDRELAAEFRDVLVAPRRKAMTAVLEQGIEAGEIRADIDVPVVIDLIFGPLWYRLLLRNAPLDDAFAVEVIDHLWASIRKPR